MRKIEVKILRDLIDNWHTRGPWVHEFTRRDLLERTTTDIFHYRLHESAIATVIPATCTYGNVTDRHLDRLVLKCGKWRTPTTISRFDAFLQYFCGITIWEHKPPRNPHTLKQIGEPKWYVAGPDYEKQEFKDGMNFFMTRDIGRDRL